MISLFVLAAAAAASVSAVPATPSPIAPVTAIARPNFTSNQGLMLPANTEIWLSTNAEVNSKRIKQDAKFPMSVTRDVMLGDYVVIPRGTKGFGQITYRTGKGAFGKSAKMEFEIVNLDLNGRLVPVNGHYRVEGQGNTGATVGTAVAVGIFSAFVTGRSAIIAQTVEYKAHLTDGLPVVLADAQPAVPTTAVEPAAATAASDTSTPAATPAAVPADAAKSDPMPAT